MEMKVKDGKICIDKEANRLDELAISFSKALAVADIRHVFLSGYVAILFGRSRSSEDVDVLCQEVAYPAFSRFWEAVGGSLECVITSDPKTAYNDYLCNRTAVRFAKKGEFIPNVEMKFAATSMHQEALESPLLILLNGNPIPVAPFEQQIAYKLYMGSEKDIEDARFMFQLFKERLDMDGLAAHLRALSYPMADARKYLGWHE